MDTQLRKKLETQTRTQLEDISEAVLGSRNAKLRSKNLLIYALEKKGAKVRSHLSMAPFKDKNWTPHIYGSLGVIGLLITLYTVFIQPGEPSLNPAPELIPGTGDSTEAEQNPPLPYDTEKTEGLTPEELIVLGQLRQAKRQLGDMAKNANAQQKRIALRDIERALSSNPDIQMSPNPKRQIVTETVEMSGDGFMASNNQNIIDLRQYRDVEDMNARLAIETGSPVVRTVTQQLEKTSDVDILRLRNSTGGFELYASSPTHDDKITTVYAVNSYEPNRDNWLRPRIIEFDMSDVPVGIPFTLTTESTYWSAFQDEDGSWGGARTYLPTDTMEILILFPKDKPFTNAEFVLNEIGSKDYVSAKPDDTVVYDEENRLWIWWQIATPSPDYGYNIDWEW